MRRTVCVSALLLMLAGCDEASSVHTSEHGTFYTPWFGGIYQVIDGQLVELRKPGPIKTINIDQNITGMVQGGYPINVKGAVKLGNGFRRIKIDVTLGNNGNQKPTPKDVSDFIQSLENGTSKLQRIILWSYDSDDFIASDPMNIDIGGSNWSEAAGVGGFGNDYKYESRQASDNGQDIDTSNITVGWVSRTEGASPPAAALEAPSTLEPPSTLESPSTGAESATQNDTGQPQ